MRSQQKLREGQQPPATKPSAELWSSAEELFWDHMREVENKWNTLKLNDDIWAKLIYFEQNRRLAKAYVSAPALTVDGSTHGLDGFRIGLSGIDNTYRSLDSMACLRSIGLGVKLRIDSQGNILIRRVGKQRDQQHCSVWFRQWPRQTTRGQQLQASSDQPAKENAKTGLLEGGEQSYKLFDMRKFRLQLERRRLAVGQRGPARWQSSDWRHCVSIISFVRSSPLIAPPKLEQPAWKSPLEEPCWLMLINIIAIDMIKSAFQEPLSPLSSLHLSNSNMELLYNNKDNQQQRPRRIGASKLAASSSALFSGSLTNTGELGGDPERAKRLRRAQRLSPMGQNLLHKHLNQSVQHLPTTTTTTTNSTSSSSTASIYTTFTAAGKLALTRRNQPTGSDYNSSASRSSHLNHHKLASGGSRRLNHQHYLSNYRYQDDGRILIPTTSPQQPCQSLSLSAFDLHRTLDSSSVTQRHRLQSAIKMNYDEEEEEADGVEEEEEEQEQEEEVPIKINDDAGKVELEATGGKPLTSSASSSSASSSGCTDHDYFLSNSSSSVASSSAAAGSGNSAASSSSSGGSQPASSSGIAGSTTGGSTSDDQGNDSGEQPRSGNLKKKLGDTSSEMVLPLTKESNQIKLNKNSDQKHDNSKQKQERCIKSGASKRSAKYQPTGKINPNCFSCCCRLTVSGGRLHDTTALQHPKHEDYGDRCAMATALALEQEQFTCNCCACDCGCYSMSLVPTTTTTEEHLNCDCHEVGDEYEASDLVESTKKCEQDDDQELDQERISPLPSADDSSLAVIRANEFVDGKVAGKPAKRGAWQRRYSRILPRFIFSSTNSSSNNNNNNRHANQPTSITRRAPEQQDNKSKI